MTVTVSAIKSFLEAEGLKYEYHGDGLLEVEGCCPLSELRSHSITWVKKAANYDFSTIDGALNLLIVADKLPSGDGAKNYSFIVAENPKMIFFEILNRFFVTPQQSFSISSSAVIETDKIGRAVSIGHHCYIGRDVSIGNNVTIKNNVVIECPTVIGNNCVIESGTIIGTFGYGYYHTPDHQIKKVPDLGGVVIGDRVEIGANVCIARGTLSNTIIHDDVKIDNLCHIAHNVRIGARSFVIALSMLGGSCTIEEDAYVAPGAMVMNQLTVGKNSLVGMGAAVTKNVEANKVVAGVPARVLRDHSLTQINI